MPYHQKTSLLLSLCLAAGIAGVVTIRLVKAGDDSSAREMAIAKEASTLTKIANEFEISPGILVSVLRSRQEVDSWSFGQRIMNFFRESENVHSERIYKIDYQTAEWVEEQIVLEGVRGETSIADLCR